MTWPKVALMSHSDLTGAVDFARALAARGTRILASGGTATHLQDAGLAVTAVEQWTGVAELLGGRVKTLHPHVHAPILARREVAADMAALAERGLDAIDLVAVTLYPFETRARGLDEPQAIETIDIGGVALLRAAAKNYADVIVVHDPARYAEVLEALERGVTLAQRRQWAIATFARTARYDAAIAAELARRAGEELPPVHVLAVERVRPLRYGENPHQRAGLYARSGERGASPPSRVGKELSYNNLLDSAAAAKLVWRFDRPACVIVKHGQPCGAASAETLGLACEGALASDPLSAYGGVVAFNASLDGETASRLAGQFVECVCAPAFDAAAQEAFKMKKNLRVLSIGPEDVTPSDPWEVRIAGKWVLIEKESQDPPPSWRLVTERAPEARELRSLRFAWEVAAAALSNAVAIARDTAVIGLGSGQTSRVDAVDVALMKARRAGHELGGAVLASDGFFPFADNVEHSARAGITAIVQPGGSVRDPEVIAACDRHRVAMMFTDRRTFRH